MSDGAQALPHRATAGGCGGQWRRGWCVGGSAMHCQMVGGKGGPGATRLACGKEEGGRRGMDMPDIR
eukprot:6682-Chlamydomonas_euryale.AAC.1